jgi:hypothetical protein
MRLLVAHVVDSPTMCPRAPATLGLGDRTCNSRWAGGVGHYLPNWWAQVSNVTENGP